MKIMIVTPYFFPKIGGLENYALNIALGLKKQGHKVLVVTTNHEGKGRKEERVKGLRVIRLPILLKLSNTPINPLWRYQIRKIIVHEKPDVINAHTPVPYIADMAVRAAKHTPVSLTYHNDLVKEKGPGKYLAKLFYVLYINKTLRISKTIIATSEYYANKSKYLRKYIYKIDIVSPGVDTDRFNTKVDKKWLKDKYPTKKILLFVGNLDKTHAHKGVDVLIKATAKIKKKFPNLLVLVIGKGDAVDNYKSLCATYKVQEIFEFLGYVEEAMLPKFYAGSDLLVLPSTTDSEGFGMVILEAAACGTPAVGSNIGGIPFAILDRHTGLLAKPGSNDSLSKNLIAALDSKILKSLGDEASIRASKSYSWQKLSQATTQTLERTQLPNIIQITPHYAPYLGGMEKVAKEISERIAKDGMTTTIITSNIGYKNDYSDPQISHLKIERLTGVEFFHLPVIWSYFPMLLRQPVGSIYHMHVAQAFLPEIALVAARIRKAKFIAHFHLDVESSGVFGFMFTLYKKTIFPMMLRSADKVIVFSEAQRLLVHRKYGVETGQIIIIPNGVDDNYFYSGKKVLHKKPRLLFVGRLSPQKNVQLLLHALKDVSNRFETKIVGDGELKNELLRTSNKLELRNVKFEGRLDGEELLSVYRWADIFILPSLKEGMPLVLLEAMAMGLPIVASNTIGISELVKAHKNGYLFKLNDAESLKQRLTQIANVKIYDALSTLSKYSSQQYGWNKLTPEYVEIYKVLHYATQ